IDLHSAASTSLQSPKVSGLAGSRAKHGQYHSTVFSKDQRSTKRSPSFETSNHCLSLSLSRNAQSKTVTFAASPQIAIFSSFLPPSQRLYKGVGIVLEETWKKSGSRL
ncbi:hypothetical protein FOC4_h10017533, partial [Fusarium odoratissimum]